VGRACPELVPANQLERLDTAFFLRVRDLLARARPVPCTHCLVETLDAWWSSTGAPRSGRLRLRPATPWCRGSRSCPSRPPDHEFSDRRAPMQRSSAQSSDNLERWRPSGACTLLVERARVGLPPGRAQLHCGDPAPWRSMGAMRHMAPGSCLHQSGTGRRGEDRRRDRGWMLVA